MTEKTADVSIIAANYNNGQYLEEFVRSVSHSEVLPKELIIVDDGSTDNSIKLLEGFKDVGFLKVIKFEKNRGFCHALNEGIKIASGKYILRIDPDDIILPNRIATQFDFLEQNKDVDVVGSNVVYFNDETGKELLTSNFPIGHKQIAETYKRGEHGVQHPTTMIRAVVMKKYKYVQKNFRAEDYEIFAKMINDGHRFANIQKPLNKMRVHGNSVSSGIKLEVIKLTFRLRDEIFKTSTSDLQILFYYWHILNYKKFLIAKNPLAKFVFLTSSAFCYPSKFIKRLGA